MLCMVCIVTVYMLLLMAISVSPRASHEWTPPPPPPPPSGLLLYLCDSIFPLLKSYYAAFFNPTVRTSDQDRKLQISSDILAALLVSCRQS